MKTKFQILPILALMAVTVFFTSCSKEDDGMIAPVSQGDLKYVTTSSGGSSVALYAGQTIPVGTVAFDDIDTDGDNTDDALQITYNLTGGWELTEIHFWMGATLTQMPMNRGGNPIIGAFPYSFSPVGQTSYSFNIPFTAINYTCASEGVYFVASHASVRLPVSGGYQNEAAWGDGLRLNQRGNWAMYYNIDITCDPIQEPEEKKTETAFAYNASYATTFISQGFNGRWGWTNGPLTTGNYNFTLWAGAGNNNLNNGTNVGTVSLNYSGSTATVTYQVNAPYKLEEVHLHLGSEMFARNNGQFTIAPGQYEYIAGDLASLSTYTFNVSGLSGNVYLVAHATVSGF